MSAIAGIFQRNKRQNVLDVGSNMMHILSKYPANATRILKSDSFFLGCHAQWITQESVGEVLPYYDSTEQLAITADAILDNREELFVALDIKRSVRNEMPDSYLMLLAYRKWGEDMPKHLLGDFAFFIWDEKEHKLFGARDFSGTRTLYYIQDPDCFAFCTTIEPLFQLPFAKKALNEEWLAQYLAITSVVDTVNPAITPYLFIKQVPPSHSITVMRDKVRLNRYCTFVDQAPIRFTSNEEYIEAFQAIFQRSVRDRLRTFRGIGSQLSGGLDSGAVVGFASRELKDDNRDLHTFSYVPPSDFTDFTHKGRMANETPYIEATVGHVGGIKAHYFDFNGRSPYTEIDRLLASLETPYKFFENSFWIKGMFEEAGKQDIGILLNGDRGNLSISYGNALDYFGKLMKSMQVVKLWQEIRNYRKIHGGSTLKRMWKVGKAAFPIVNKQKDYIYPTIINQDFANRTGVYKQLRSFGIGETGWYSSGQNLDLRRMHYNDLFHWSATNMVSTKLSLIHNVWKRDPTNDLRVINFCLALPEGQFVQKGYDRSLIRRATKSYLPDMVRLNRHVRGVQGLDWLHRMQPDWNAFANEMEQMLENKQLQAFIDWEALTDAWQHVKADFSPNNSGNPNHRIVMRIFILNRFINRNF